MSLPKIETPIYKLKLPISKKEVRYRPFLVKEEKILLLAMTQSDKMTLLDAIVEMVKSCTMGDVDIEQLPSGDVEYLFLNLRSISKGNVIEMNFRCANMIKDEAGNEKECGHTTKILFDTATAKVSNVETREKNIQITDTIGITMREPTFKDMMEIKMMQDDPKLYFKILSMFIESAYDGDTVYSDFSDEELEEFVDAFTTEAKNKIKEFFETIPRLIATVKVKCSNCGHEEEIKLVGLESFLD